MNKINVNNQKFRISNLNEQLIIPCGVTNRLVLNFVTVHNNTWSTAVIAVRRSLDSDNVVEFPTAITVSGETTIELDTSTSRYVHLVVTTAQSGTSDIYINSMQTEYLAG